MHALRRAWLPSSWSGVLEAQLSAASSLRRCLVFYMTPPLSGCPRTGMAPAGIRLSNWSGPTSLRP